MQHVAGRLGFVGGALSLAFWVIVPLAVANTYIHSDQATMVALFILLSAAGIIGAVLSRVRPGWGAALMALGAIPGIAALIVPGVFLGVAALMALGPEEIGMERRTGSKA